MEPLNSSHTSDINEFRRLRAYELDEQGWQQRWIAKALGVTDGAVSQWLKRAREQGVQSLKKRPLPGAKPRLSQEQKAQIPALLAKGAESFGFRGDVWTQPRIAAMIKHEFGVCYHPAHMTRLLRECGCSRQKPKRRATQRNEQAIKIWLDQRWPELKKTP